MVGEPQVFGRSRVEIGHRLVGIAVEHLDNMDGGEKTVVIAAPDRRVEKEMAGFFEAGERLEIGDAALDVGMAGLPIIGLDAVASEAGIGGEKAGRFDIDDEGRARIEVSRDPAPA